MANARIAHALAKTVWRSLIVALLAGLLSAGGAQAVQPDEILPDAAQEQRARALSAGLRCLVCQNQSIDDSDAPLARDLRLIVRERITAGDSDAAVIDYVVSRYGEYVLLKPPFNSATLLLWLSPLFLLIGGIWLGRKVMRTSTVPEAPAALTDDEQRRLAEILDRKA